MRGSLFFVVVAFAAFSTPAAAGPVDTIAIVEPLDETYFPEAPIDLTVVVESANKSGLVFELVGLEVDGIPVPADQTCDGPGTCMFLVPLEEGDHELRAYAERNIGPPLESDLVKIQVGGRPPVDPTPDTTGAATGSSTGSDVDDTTGAAATTTGDGSSSDGSTTSGTTAPAGSSSEGSDTSGPASDAGGGGCGCRQHTGFGGAALLSCLLFGALGRRRPGPKAR